MKNNFPQIFVVIVYIPKIKMLIPPLYTVRRLTNNNDFLSSIIAVSLFLKHVRTLDSVNIKTAGYNGIDEKTYTNKMYFVCTYI